MKLLNRSFKFGDGLFETMRWHDGKIFNLNLHHQRLLKGLNVLGIESPKDFETNYLEALCSKHIHQKNQNADSPDWRIRISCFRAGEGLYTPLENKMEYFIEASPLTNSNFVLNKSGLCLGKYHKVQITTDILSNLKTTSALPYVMAARYRQSNPDIDDCLLFNVHGRVVESIAANLFYRVKDQLYTPRLEEGGVAGTMRQFILNHAELMHLNIKEVQLKLVDLEQADEIFLTNAIQGLRWVKQLSWKPELEFSNTYSQLLTDHLNHYLKQLRVEI